MDCTSAPRDPSPTSRRNTTIRTRQTTCIGATDQERRNHNTQEEGRRPPYSGERTLALSRAICNIIGDFAYWPPNHYSLSRARWFFQRTKNCAKTLIALRQRFPVALSSVQRKAESQTIRSTTAGPAAITEWCLERDPGSFNERSQWVPYPRVFPPIRADTPLAGALISADNPIVSKANTKHSLEFHHNTSLIQKP